MTSPLVPFSEEVLQICASLSQYATVEDIRGAMVAATKEVNLFLTISPSGSAELLFSPDKKGFKEEFRSNKEEQGIEDKGKEPEGAEGQKDSDAAPSSPLVETEVLMIWELLQCCDTSALERSTSTIFSTERERAPSISGNFFTSSPSALSDMHKRKQNSSTNNTVASNNSVIVSVSLNTADTLESMRVRNGNRARRGVNTGKPQPSVSSSVLPISHAPSYISPTCVVEVPLSCIFITRKQRIDMDTGRPCSVLPSSTEQKVLGIKDVCIHSLDVTRPLDVLECSLRNVYEPMFRKKRYQLDIRSQLRDLLQSIQAMRRRLPEFRARDYVEDHILSLCKAHPRLDPPQLVEHLGELGTNPEYIRKVKQVKEKSKMILEKPPFLPQLKGESSASSGGEGNFMEQIGSTEILSVVSEKVKEWRWTARWVDDVLRELELPEWKVLYLLLRSSGDTTYVREFQQYKQQIDRLISYLRTIPEMPVCRNPSSFYAFASQIMEAICKAPESFLFLAHSLLNDVTLELLCRWIAWSMEIKEHSTTSPSSAAVGGEANAKGAAWNAVSPVSATFRKTIGTGVAGEGAGWRGGDAPRSTLFTGGKPQLHTTTTGSRRYDHGAEEEAAEVLDNLLRVVDTSLEVAQWLVEKYTYTKASLPLSSSTASSVSSSFAGRNALRHSTFTPSSFATLSNAATGGSVIPSEVPPATAVTTGLSATSAGGGSSAGGSHYVESAIEPFRVRLIRIQGFLELHTLRLHHLETVFANNSFLRGAWRQYINSGGAAVEETLPLAMIGSNEEEGETHEKVGHEEEVEGKQDLSQPFSSSSAPLAYTRKSLKSVRKEGGDVEDVLAALKNAFTEFLEDLSSCSSFPSPSGGSETPERILWGINPRSTELLEECMNAYHAKVDALDLRLAAFVHDVLAQQYARRTTTANMDGSNSEVVHTTHNTDFLWAFTRFQWVPLPHVKQVLRQYQEKVEEQLESLYTRIRMDYYNTEMTQPLWRLSRFHLGVSKFAAAIVTRQDFVLALKRCDDSRHYLLEKGWHQLLILRHHRSHYWRLNANLADFVGVPLEAMVTQGNLKAGSTVHGCAVALAYLKLLYPNEDGWKADPYLQLAVELVEKQEPGAVEKATNVLILHRVLHRATVRELKGFSTIYEDSKNRLFQNMVAWLEYAQSKLHMLKSASAIHPEEFILQGPILSVVDVTRRVDALARRQRGVNAGALAISGWLQPLGQSPSHPQQQQVARRKTATGGLQKEEVCYQLDVVFPTVYFELAADIRYIDGAKLCKILPEHRSTEVGEVQKFVQRNEHRCQLAVSLVELLRVYYAVVNGEDDTLALLAGDPYREVNEILVAAYRLHWEQEREVKIVIETLSRKLLTLTDKVKEVRQQSEAVYQKIIRMHSQPYHPEAIVQAVHDIRAITTALAMDSLSAHVWAERQVQPLLDAALLDQLRFLFHGWTVDFLSMADNPQFLDSSAETPVFHLRPLRLRMVVVFKVVRLEKPPQAWRGYWLQRLNNYFHWVNTIPRLCSTSAQETGTLSSLDEINPVLSSVSIGKGGVGGLEQEKGYSHLLRLLPPTVLAEPLKAIEKCIQDTIAAEREWQISQQFLNIDINVMQQRFGTDLRRWVHAIRHMHHVTKQLIDVTQPNKLLGGIVMCVEGVQNELSRKMDQVLQFVLSKFTRILEQQMNTSSARIKETFSKAESWNVISKNEDAMEFLCEEPNITQELTETEALLELFMESESTLLHLGHLFPDNWMGAARMKEDYRSLKDLVNRKKTAVEVRHTELEESVNKKVQQLQASITHLQVQVQDLDAQHARRTPMVVQQMVEELFTACTGLKKEVEKTHRIQDALGVPAADLSALNNVTSIVDTLRDVWSRASQVDKRLHALCGTLFFDIQPQWMQEELQAMEAELDSFPLSLKAFRVYLDLLERVKFIGSCRRYIADLRSDAMAPLERAQRHWITLKQRLGAPWIIERLTLQDILQFNPVENASVYLEVLEAAQGERRIEVQLGHISSFWESFQLSLTLYKKQTCLVRGWDALFDRLADDLGSCSGMRASPFFHAPPLISAVNEVENRLNHLRQILEMLVDIQKRWVYLDGIFTGNNEIRMQLPHDTVQFERTTREFMTILPRPRAGGVLPQVGVQFFLQDEKLYQTLERLSNQINEVQHALTAYLDGQRRRFPRFFFVGDDDLLEIMGNGADPNFLSRHLRKMFTGLSSFVVELETLRLLGFSSVEGEVVLYRRIATDPQNPLLSAPIEVKQRPLYDWLLEAESSMVNTLRSETMIAAKALESAGCVSVEWMKEHPTQVLCLSLQLWWVTLQEKHFEALSLSEGRSASSNIKNTISRDARSGEPHHPTRRSIPARGEDRQRSKKHAVSPVTEEMDRLLAQLANSVLDAQVQTGMRHRFEQMITIAVYQRDTSRALALANVRSPLEFEWSRVLRPYICHASSHKTGVEKGKGGPSEDVVCRMADASITHGFEYTGNYERLVQTPLTDKCYFTLTQALHTRMGGSPVGPAGTGKTETVKALGMQLGRHVLVFNCDDTFDYMAVSRIFLGLCQVGAWGCFDEFNRLEERIMSALSLQIQLIQESLRRQQKEVEMHSKLIPLHPNVAIFITMNPGYAGRSNLPGNLKQLFRTVTMTVPDRETIAEVMLFAQGFHTAEHLSRKIVPLFRLCDDQFSKQAHYDFGLRALKSVLVAAGKRKRAASGKSEGGSTSASSYAEGVNMGSIHQEESNFMLSCIIDNIAPKLITEDVSLFYPLLKDFFPHHELPTNMYQDIEDAVHEVCRETGLSAAPAWVEKICQLHSTQTTRHGIMIVGPSGSGKTMAWKVLMAASVRANPSVEIRSYVIEPKVLAKTELFGSLDITTREWKDGIFSSVLRRIIESENKKKEEEQQLKQQEIRNVVETGDRNFSSSPSSPHLLKKVQHWIVFDGDVDPEWVENLNSVLDDNKILTLPNGERLALPSSVRILFEVENLRYATPATVSRCGMLWFSEGLVPLAGVLTYAYQQLERAPMTDARGRHLTFSMEVGQIGIPEDVKAGKPRVSVHYGKAFHELVATVVVRRPEDGDSEVPLTDDEVDVDQFSINQNDGAGTESVHEEEELSSPRKKEGASIEESLFLASPLKGNKEGRNRFQEGGERGKGASSTSGTASAQSGNPDAWRIQSAILRAAAAAFGRHGLIAKGIALVSSSAYRPHCIMELNTMQLLQGVLALLWEGIWRTFCAEQASGSGPLPPHVLAKVAEKLIVYAMVWGLGSPLSYTNRDRFAAELHLDATVTGGATRSVTEVEVDYLTGAWRLVRDRVQEVPILAEQVGANDTVIPTVDTERHKDVLSSWIASGRSAILCGPPGSGKTMSINSVLSHSHEYTAAFLNFSSGTTVEMITKCLEQYCVIKNTARGFVMTPNSSSDKSKLLLFCDEINLPALDSYGTQSVLQLLRQIIECGGYFRPRDNVWIHVERVQVVGACNPPTDPGRIPLPHRLLRWAPVLFVDFPSEDSLHIIYTTYCRAILSDNLQLARNYAGALASAMVNIYLSSQEHFTPFQQPHYLYSPRELSRWSRAIYEGLLTWDESERKEMKVEVLVRLVVHEGLRVFSDRLVTEEERQWEDLVIDNAFREQFPEVPSSAYERPLLFSTMLQRNYSDCSRDDLRDMIEKRLQLFCEEEVSAPLVVYDAMLDHIVRLDRVLRQPLGHMLMAGASGVGKSMIARLSAWMSGYSTFWLQVHRDYDIVAFEEDLRGLLRRSGCKGEKICFIFDESNIMQPSFLEYMNALLASGEVPGLFEGEEWVKLIQDIREAVTLAKSSVAASTVASASMGVATNWETEGNAVRGGDGVGEGGGSATKARPPSTTAAHMSGVRGNTGAGVAGGSMAALPHLPTASDYDLYRWFLQNVKERLHVVFTINPSSAEFSSRAVASPALFNRCTIDWLGDWEYDTLAQMARARIQDQKLLSSGNLQEDDHFPSEDACRESVVSALCAIHLKTCEINHTLRVRHGNSGTFITPRHFTDMGTHFVRLFQMKCNDSEEQMHHLRSGLKKLDETSADIEEQRKTLKESEKLIAENSKEAQKMLDRIVVETDTTKKEKEAAEKLRCQLQEEEARIMQDKTVIENDLSKVEPALREAEAALNTVKPEYLREIRAYTTPPPMVQRVLEAVLTLMGERNTEDWDTVKGHIRRDDFLSGVKAFKPTDVKDSAHDRVNELMRDNLKVEAAYRASKAAGPLLQWVFAQVDYAKIYKKLRPMQQKVEELTKEHEKKSTELQETEEDISQKEAFLLQLKTEYQVTTEKIADLKHRTSAIAAKCERATTILGQLLDEQSRWEEEVHTFDAYARTKIGDCILSASFLSYIGFFDESVRERVLLPGWLQCLEVAKIPTRTQLNVLHYLVTPTMQLEWEQHGLPKDKLCAENTMIIGNTQRFPLLIDPTGTATCFLQNKYAMRKIRKASFTQNGYLKQLEMAVRFGYPIILEDAEFLDPAVTPLLNQEYRMSGGRQVARIGPHEVDLSSSFKLFLVTRDSNYQPSPTLAGQTSLVNFTITQSSLDFQCLHRLILHERPDIDAKRSELLKVQGEYQMRLRVLEQKLLTTIAEAKGSLLEDDQLISTLASLKTEARTMQDDINNGDDAMRIIQRVEQRYRPLSQVLSATFFALKSFSDLSTFYQYNVEFIFRVIKDALNALPARSNPPANITTPTATASGTLSSSSPSSASKGGDVNNEECVEEELSRIQVLLSYVFNLIHHRVVRGMFSQDHLVLELRLAHMRSGVSKYLPRNLLPSNDLSVNNMRIPEISSDEKRRVEEEENRWGEESPTTLAMLQRVYGVEVSSEEWEWLLEGLRGSAATATEAGSLDKESRNLVHTSEGKRTHLGFTSDEEADASSPGLATTSLDAKCRSTLEKCGVLPSSNVRQAALAVLLQRTAFHSICSSLQNPAHFSLWKAFFESSSPIAEQERILPAEAFASGEGEISPVRRYFVLTVLLFYTRQDDFLSAVLRTLHAFFEGRSTSPPRSSADLEGEKKKNLPYGIEDFFSLPTRNVVADAMPELSSSSPLLMVCDANYDPSDSVEELARESGVVIRAAAMGSIESTSAAQKFVEEGIKTGCWVLLKNVHLARAYVSQTEKLIHAQRLEGRLHENFRLFLTAERGGGGGGAVSSRESVLPTNLLEECVLVVLEPPPGIKFSMMRTYGRLEPSRGSHLLAASSEKGKEGETGRGSGRQVVDPAFPTLLSLHRLYMAAAWVHALITERLFYVPVGWTKKYEFSDAEYMRIVQAVDACILPQEKQQKKSTAAPPYSSLHVDWVALRAVIAETVYGGKISNAFDQLVVDLLCENTLNDKLWEDNYSFIRSNGMFSQADAKDNAKEPLEESTASVTNRHTHATVSLVPPALPREMNRSQLLQWIARLPEGSAPPQWLGLPNCVARVMRSKKAMDVLERLSVVQTGWTDQGAEAEGGWGGMRTTANISEGEGNVRASFSLGAAVSPKSGGVKGIGEASTGGAVRGDGTTAMSKAPWVEKMSMFCRVWRPVFQRLAKAFEEHTILGGVESSEAGGTRMGRREGSVGNGPTGMGGRRNGRGSHLVSASSVLSGGGDTESPSPLKLAIQRETDMAARLVYLLFSEVTGLEEVVEGRKKAAAMHRLLVDNLTKELVPSQWRAQHYVLASMKLSLYPWLSEVLQRLEHILLLANEVVREERPFGLAHAPSICLGLLFSPGGFLTAFKQQYARERKHLSLEKLRPHVRLECTSTHRMTSGASPTSGKTKEQQSVGDDDGCLCFTGITLYSAQVREVSLAHDDGRVIKKKSVASLIDPASTSIDALTSQVNLWWSWATSTTGSEDDQNVPLNTLSKDHPSTENTESISQQSHKVHLGQQDVSQCSIAIPLYSTATRETLLDVIDVEIENGRVEENEEENRVENTVGMWYERGVCMTAWNPSD